ncbi:MAG: hypothetical protein R6W90_10535, partial [Ignavibacteriaceae bacterium]
MKIAQNPVFILFFLIITALPVQSQQDTLDSVSPGDTIQSQLSEDSQVTEAEEDSADTLSEENTTQFRSAEYPLTTGSQAGSLSSQAGQDTSGSAPADTAGSGAMDDSLDINVKGDSIQTQPKADNPPSTTIYTPPRRRHNLRYEPKLNPLLPQQKVDTSAVDLWVPAATIGLNVSQIALSNWTQGGE